MGAKSVGVGWGMGMGTGTTGTVGDGDELLSPCSSLVYINVIEDLVNNKIPKFADDTKIFNTVSSVQKRMSIVYAVIYAT